MIRADIAPKDEADNNSDNYASVDKEVIARAPIIYYGYDEEAPDIELTATATFTPEAADDMTLGWDVLHKVIGSKSDWVHVKQTKTTKNGRHAYFLIKKMVMGE